jgi:hypothetical protein
MGIWSMNELLLKMAINAAAEGLLCSSPIVAQSFLRRRRLGMGRFPCAATCNEMSQMANKFLQKRRRAGSA